MSDPHKIWRQVLDIRLSENKETYSIQSRVRDVYYDQLLPLIEQKLNELYHGEDTLVIDRLEFDLGELKLHDFDSSAVLKLEEKLNELILTTGTDIRNEISKQKAHGAATAIHGSKVHWEKNTPKKSDFEAVITFLEKGILPWTKSGPNFQEKSITSFVDQVMINQSVEISEFVRRNLHRLAIQQRIVHHFSEKSIREILVINLGKKIKLAQVEIEQLLKEIAELLRLPPLLRTDKAKVIWLNLHLATLEQETTQAEQRFLPNLMRSIRFEFPNVMISPVQIIEELVSKKSKYPQLIHWFSKSGTDLKVLEESIRAKSTTKRTKAEEGSKSRPTPMIPSEWVGIRKNLMSFIEQLSVEHKKSVDDWLTELMLPTEISGSSSVKTADKQKGSTEIESSKPDMIKKVIVEEGVSIENAGLVIVAYFLPFLFRHFGWVEDGGSIKQNEIPKALATTQFIVSGTEVTDESQLLLNKLLLGLDPEEVITNDYRLSTEEKAEAENLLSNIISKWKSLGSTSIDGLRQTFLQRNGILYEREENYALLVERKSLDILMDQLPWSIGIIKLSWMPKIIAVEW